MGRHKLTPWFEGPDPVRAGWYDTNRDLWSSSRATTARRYWDGYVWRSRPAGSLQGVYAWRGEAQPRSDYVATAPLCTFDHERLD